MKKITLIFMAVAAIFTSTALNAKDNVKKTGLKVISYNIRYGDAKDGTNSWQYRYPASALMILDQQPDIWGVQEALDYQIKYLAEALPEYKNIGVGREDGKHGGEHMSIFYNTKTVKLLKWGTYWLSETPDEPSMGWDAACKRTATWAYMKDKKTGKKFYYVNTHLDHRGAEAQKNGLALIMDRVAAMNPAGEPMIITGDFNLTIDSPCLSEIKARMKNSREIAAKTDHNITYNAWGHSEDSCIIDYVWYSGFTGCPVYETITKPYYDRTFVSDHFPVTATLIF